MIKKIEEKVIKMNPQQAGRTLEHNTLSFQRPVKEDHVTELAVAMLDGLFLTGSIVLAKLDYNGGQTVMVNGQHQCRAIIESGQTVDVCFTKYSVESPLELSLLYRQFDNNYIRSTADCIRPESAALNIKWPVRLQSLVVSGAKYREGKPRMKKTEAVALLQAYRERGDFICSVMAPNGALQTGHLLRAIVACAMMITWEKNRQEAYNFWVDVRDGEHLKKYMPAYQLREYLKSIGVNNGSGSRNYKRVASEPEILSRCITAWNAVRKNTTTRLAYFSDKPIPKAI
jgi:hypothetical protein